MPQVNGQNVVKVGHRQVVNMIRQGGNTLMVKVVMVTRHPDMDEAVHKKGAPPPALCGQAWTLPAPAAATGLRLSAALMKAGDGWWPGLVNQREHAAVCLSFQPSCARILD